MYKFPTIKTIDDVLPSIKGWDKFIVAERDDYDVINYLVAFPETFSTEHDGWEVRRECRGLIFDKAGKLISRPFHKFFNVNEKPDVHQSILPLGEEHLILDKADGSMIRPIPIGGDIRLGTKMGVTEIAEHAEQWLSLFSDNKLIWLDHMVHNGYTPLFEYVGPQNRIVLDYEKEDLILLAIRHNETGAYMYHWSPMFKAAPFTPVTSYGSVDGDIQQFIDKARAERDVEGNIIFWPKTGLMVKFKNDWYVQLHKILDEVRSWRHVAAKQYNNEIDDVLPKLDVEDRKLIEKFLADLHHSEQVMIEHVDVVCRAVVEDYGNDRKRIALEYIAGLEKNDKWLSKFIFSYLDGREAKDLVRAHITKHVGSITKFNECLEWLGMAEYKQ